MRTPERRTLTGCRWRINEPRTASTRLRFVLGMPTRKTDFQICELTMPSWISRRFAIVSSCGVWGVGSGGWERRLSAPTPYSPHPPSHLDKRLGISPLPALLVELLRFVDDDLAVGDVNEDLGPFERTRSRSFEVDSGLV